MSQFDPSVELLMNFCAVKVSQAKIQNYMELIKKTWKLGERDVVPVLKNLRPHHHCDIIGKPRHNDLVQVL